MRPVVALLTDFGLRDHYVGTMKGVVLGICPEATLVDITHDIPPQDVLGGALELSAAFRYFPLGTAFLAVVDPGVGSGRPAMAASAGGYTFVAPDNGLLAPVLDELAPATIVRLTEPDGPISRTFEGRDRFAPAAARLARGEPLSALGSLTAGYQALAVPAPVPAAGGLDGEVLRVDRFGNLLTNIHRTQLEALRAHDGPPLVVSIAGHGAGPLVATYSDVVAGALCALVGSSGRLEVAVSGGSAAERLGAGRGARVSVRRREAHLDEGQDRR